MRRPVRTWHSVRGIALTLRSDSRTRCTAPGTPDGGTRGGIRQNSVRRRLVRLACSDLVDDYFVFAPENLLTAATPPPRPVRSALDPYGAELALVRTPFDEFELFDEPTGVDPSCHRLPQPARQPSTAFDSC